MFKAPEQHCKSSSGSIVIVVLDMLEDFKEGSTFEAGCRHSFFDELFRKCIGKIHMVLLIPYCFFTGMDFHELLDIPQGDRRKYHDDVSVMVISLEGRIWRSSS
ncbi:hypothetical protein B296_00040971 [Ensete ventricosum]|uniref:protein-serine/threonine phosphatase n=1 Tax=Ensete ventricosum TaxID=4639 RepID=A0A426Z1N8_ENSVE|nr:hypothetical protein B296_00040971 [Ensete ventricosum]